MFACIGEGDTVGRLVFTPPTVAMLAGVGVAQEPRTAPFPPAGAPQALLTAF